MINCASLAFYLASTCAGEISATNFVATEQILCDGSLIAVHIDNVAAYEEIDDMTALTSPDLDILDCSTGNGLILAPKTRNIQSYFSLVDTASSIELLSH